MYRGIGHIRRDHKDPIAVTLSAIIQLSRCARGGHNLVANVQCGLGQRAAEAARRTSDEPRVRCHVFSRT
jgi:hypothetical protein